MLSRKTTYFLLAIAAAGIVLSGCGRKGDLDRPGATTINRKAAPGTTEKKPEAPERPFLLDPLL
ncbi:putative small lipoprotein YifL [Pararhizobium capsulatum DSM 1112]|uniref:Small lipoprotein YifL n=1 Tax=Pararhizobium capsulatum DSM 1112 TaxID=1121113 RepID=A0ABU0BXP9_9HYPH|nr:lipoprotein [Pararhizobium capsulatum]MDQ0321622.1 putative small lipoprotein YifL [Pararhizobium capsulatum DSM 1112]